MQYAHRWHREGCGCDDWRRWSNLRSSPLVVQPTAAFDLFVPWRQKWRDLPGSNQWNSDQHKFRKQKFVKETQTSNSFWKKINLSLSLQEPQISGENSLSLGSEGDHSLELVHLYSTAESSPASRHVSKNATKRYVSTGLTSAAACRKCMRAATALLEPIKTWQYLFRTSHYLC